MTASRSEAEDGVADVVGPVVAQAGLLLEDVRVRTVGRRRQVRITVDADGGVTADGLADVSRSVSRALDVDDPLGSGAYTLEVSTPGIDRPLTRPAHWRRAKGRLVVAHVRDGQAVSGRVADVTDDGVVLAPASGAAVDLTWDALVRGQVQVEFDHPETAWGALEDGSSGGAR